MTSATPTAVCSTAGASVAGPAWPMAGRVERLDARPAVALRPGQRGVGLVHELASVGGQRRDRPRRRPRTSAAPARPRPGRTSIDAARSRRATAAAASAVAPGRSRANSSPPVRKARSVGRSVAWMSRPNARQRLRRRRRGRRASLTAWKSSRSMRTSPSDVCRVRAASTWRSNASWKARWLPRPGEDVAERVDPGELVHVAQPAARGLELLGRSEHLAGHPEDERRRAASRTGRAGRRAARAARRAGSGRRAGSTSRSARPSALVAEIWSRRPAGATSAERRDRRRRDRSMSRAVPPDGCWAPGELDEPVKGQLDPDDADRASRTGPRP